MHKYKMAKQMKKTTVAALVAGFLLTGSTLTYAAGIGFAEAYDVIYEATEVEYQEELQPLKEMEEYYEPDGWQAYTTVVTEPLPDQNERTRWTSFEWTVSAKTLKKTSKVYLSAGDVVYISIVIDPDGQDVNVGLIDNGASKRYVTGSSQISHEFQINRSGYYSIFVENKNSVDVNVGGHFTK